MIRIRKRREPDDPSNSGSLNDLSFLLIIFFIVIAGFNVNKGFLLNLPDREKARVVQTRELMKCFISETGAISMDGSEIDVPTLRDKSSKRLAEFPNMTFLLEVHPDAPYGSVISVIHEVRAMNIENFSFRMSEGAL